MRNEETSYGEHGSVKITVICFSDASIEPCSFYTERNEAHERVGEARRETYIVVAKVGSRTKGRKKTHTCNDDQNDPHI